MVWKRYFSFSGCDVAFLLTVLSLTGKNLVVTKRTQDAICLAVKTRFKIANWFCTNFDCFVLFCVIFTHRAWHHKLVAFQGSCDASSSTSSGYSTSSSMYASESSLSSQKQSEVATPTLQSVPEYPRSTASVSPQPLVSNVTTNFTRQFFRQVSCFDAC